MGNSTSSKAADQAASGAYSPTPREENVYDHSFPPGPPTSSASSRYSASSGGTSSVQPPALFSESTTPPVPPRGLERRANTVVSRDRRSETVSACLAHSGPKFTHFLPPSHSPSFSPPHYIHFCSCHFSLPLPPPSPPSQRAALAHRRLSTSDVSSSASDANASDNLTDHVLTNQPKELATDVPLGTVISVQFDRDVRTVNINKLFEVSSWHGKLFARGVVFITWCAPRVYRDS